VQLGAVRSSESKVERRRGDELTADVIFGWTQVVKQKAETLSMEGQADWKMLTV